MRAICVSLIFLLFVYRIKGEYKGVYYPLYHLAPPLGQWMNDPNGFSYFKGEYHLFYQNNPESTTLPGIAHWGHAKSPDLVHWKHLPIAMYPDQPYDHSGVFSGSTLVEDNTMYIYYTGHDKNTETPPYTETQNLAICKDGVNVVKYKNNPVIDGTKNQPDVRDPKVWKHGNTYYMVLGNSFNDGKLGRILLYTSKNKLNWTQASILGESDGKLGYMWECPDLFELNGRFVLLFSPQGVKPEGDKYNSLYQTGYFVGKFDYRTNIFTPIQDFVELDHGHDFYATQTVLDHKGRRIVVGWFDMWDQNYPEGADGFSGQMTLPRILSLSKDLKLIQKPVPEIRSARSRIVRSGPAWGGTKVPINKAAEINVRASPLEDLELYIESTTVSVKILYESDTHRISLTRGESDLRRTEWKPFGALVLNIYIDSSSIEVFCGSGEVTFSSRYFPDGDVNVRLGDESDVFQLRVINLKQTTLSY